MRMDSFASPERTARALLPLLLATATLAVTSRVAEAACSNANVSSCGILDVADLDLEEDNVRGDGLYVLNISDCRSLIEDNPTITLEFRLSFTVTTEDYGLKISRGDVQCDTASIDRSASDDDGCRVFAKDQITESSSNVFRRAFTAQDLLEISSVDECSDSTLDDVEVDIDFIFQNTANGDGTDTTPQSGTITLRLATDRPTAPALESVSAGGQTIEVDWESAGTDETYEYRVYYDETPFSSGASPEDLTSARTAGPTSNTSLTITSGVLENRTYYVGVVTVDEARNESVLSDVLDVETIPTADFFEHYRDLGGAEEGGYCAAGTGGGGNAMLVGLALLGLLAASRRRVGASLVTFAAVGLVAPAGASAQATLSTLEIERSYESPITGMLEIRLSPFDPAIDEELAGADPWDDVFGDRNPWNLEFAYDYQVWRGIGSLGVTGEVGYVRVKGRAIAGDGSRSPDQTRFSRVPLRVGAVYRFDYLQTRWNVPFVLSLKAGLDYHFWRTKGPEGVSTTDDGSGDTLRGRGATHGWHAGVGVQLLLDWFAPGMARGFDSSVGVNNSYLFGEYRWEGIDDFGDEKSWDLSSPSFVFGLAFEF
jgi:hypothetical protein